MIADVCYVRHAAWLAVPLVERRALETAAAKVDRREPMEHLVACDLGCGADEDEPCRDTDCGPRCRCPRCDPDGARDRRNELASYRRNA